MDNSIMDKIVSLCKRRGFVFQASEIYGGTGSVWDFGPLGVELKNNIKNLWWREFVIKKNNIVGLDSAIIQNPKVWEASGHLKSFTDPLVECKKCHQRFRDDHVKEANLASDPTEEQKRMINCDDGSKHEFTEAKEFNLMFKTYIGSTEDSSSITYLRPETAQGIFTNFENVLSTSRQKIPFGIAQIGKAFRNEITPGNFIFRTREFEQAEIEFFIYPSAEESKKWYEYWIAEAERFYSLLGIKKENLSLRKHEKDELSHYSIGTTDIEYKFPFGVSELGGIAQRTDFDLKAHQENSGQNMEYFDQNEQKSYLPYVVEPSLGIDRATLAVLVDAYRESDGSDERAKGEVMLAFDPKIAPIKVAVFPLVKKEEIIKIAQEISGSLSSSYISNFYDESGSIGRRYRRQDEVGTPWCVTVDFETLDDQSVTVRDRDTLKQERIKISELKEYFSNRLQ